MNKHVCELPKNSRKVYQFRLGEFEGHNFINMRIFTKEDGWTRRTYFSLFSF